jgi:uncharacterized protein (TIGR02145 family)
VTLTDASLTADSVNLPLTIASKEHSVTLKGGPGIYSGQFTITTSSGNAGKNTFVVSDTATIIAHYDDKSAKMTVSDTCVWRQKTKASLVFGSGDVMAVYDGSVIFVRLYDNNVPYWDGVIPVIHIKNELTGDTLNLITNESYERFSAYFYVSPEKAKGVMWIPDTTYITASYYDETYKELITQRMLVYPSRQSPYKPYSIKFNATEYEGFNSMATVTYTNTKDRTFLTTFKVTSTSDTAGYLFSSEIVDNNMLRQSIRFTKDKSGDGKLHVEHGDIIKILYTSPSGDTAFATARWKAGLDADTEGLPCKTDSTALFSGKYDSTQKYVCDGGKFRKATAFEIYLEKACVKSSIGKTVSNASMDYVCTEDGFDVKYGELPDSRDGTKYKTVRVGEQTWMAENLNYSDDSFESLCYDNDPNECKKNGRLYTWTVAMRIEESYSAELYRDEDTTTVKGICPSGSRLPSKAEWDTLLESGVLFIESSALSGNFWGLGITPSGYQISGSFTGKGTHAAFWTASETAAATSYGAFYNGYTRQPQTTSKTAALSVRCILD